MIRRSRRQPLHDRLNRVHTVLGIATITAFAIFGYVSFTANSGLPFTSSYSLAVNVPNTDRITKSDEVRIDGVRVGQVQSVAAIAPRTGRPYARLMLMLSPSVGPLPVDTGVSIGQASILGDADVDLVPGHSRVTVASGGMLPLADAHATVQLTDLLGVFNHGTAQGIQRSFGALGPGLAGRGAALNTTIASLRSLLGPLACVSAPLATPATRLSGLITGYEQFSGALDPVSVQLARAFQNGGTTLRTLATHSASLAGTIDSLPPAETVVTSAFARLDPALAGLANIATQLTPPARLLPAALAQTNSTLAAGIAPLQQLPRFSTVLRTALEAVQTTSSQATVPGAVRQLVSLFDASAPFVSALEQAQVYCNVFGLWGTDFAGLWIKLGFPGGPNLIPISVTHLGAQGEIFQHAAPSANAANNYVANANAQECESGNEPYANRLALGNPPGPQSSHTRATSPPAGVLAFAQRAGLLTPPAGRQ
ncbi:MAG: MlaD family protein [Solirubrobacteraceae bacterium]